MNHFVGHLLQVEVLLSINQERLQPSATKLAKTLLHIFLAWSDSLLARFAFKEGTHKGLGHPHDFSLHLVLKFPLLARKQPRFVLKVNRAEEPVFRVHYVCLPFEAEFSVTHCQTRHLTGGGLEDHAPSVVELDGVEAFIHPLS